MEYLMALSLVLGVLVAWWASAPDQELLRALREHERWVREQKHDEIRGGA